MQALSAAGPAGAPAAGTMKIKRFAARKGSVQVRAGGPRLFDKLLARSHKELLDCAQRVLNPRLVDPSLLPPSEATTPEDLERFDHALRSAYEDLRARVEQAALLWPSTDGGVVSRSASTPEPTAAVVPVSRRPAGGRRRGGS
jgi:hypothetical protein